VVAKPKHFINDCLSFAIELVFEVSKTPAVDLIALISALWFG
jgi:hypothetical protein